MAATNPNGHVNGHILGQAQRSYHDVDAVDHPLELMRAIAAAAVADAGIDPTTVDAVGVVDPFSWTYPDLTGLVAEGIGCRPDIEEVWLPGGGTTPIDLLHTVIAAMAEGRYDVAVLVGAEAMRTRRKATRAGQELPWPPRDRSVNPMRGQPPFASEWEERHGFRLPIHVFPAIENAIGAAHGRRTHEQRELAARLLAENARVAAGNPNAWFQDAPDATAISEVTADNRMIAHPYTKRMNSIMDVDQAAAIVVVSDRFLDAHGGRDRATAVLGGAGAEEVWDPSRRPDLASCNAMSIAFGRALDEAGITVADIDAFDFYSCFPSPIQLAAEALGIGVDDPRPFTITGGLAYAGGPGNNYVMHSLATAASRLREHRDETLMVTGVGMANTKHAATILASSDHVPAGATGTTTYRILNEQQPRPLGERLEGPATVVTYTIEYDRDANPTRVIYILDTDDGLRAMANAPDPAGVEGQLLTIEPIGRRGQLRWDATEGRQLFILD